MVMLSSIRWNLKYSSRVGGTQSISTAWSRSIKYEPCASRRKLGERNWGWLALSTPVRRVSDSVHRWAPFGSVLFEPHAIFFSGYFHLSIEHIQLNKKSLGVWSLYRSRWPRTGPSASFVLEKPTNPFCSSHIPFLGVVLKSFEPFPTTPPSSKCRRTIVQIVKKKKAVSTVREWVTAIGFAIF